MDADANDIASALSNCITRDGQGKPSAAMDWNGQNLNNVNALAASSATLTGALAAASATLSTAPASADSSTKVPTTAWVNANTPGRLLNVQVFTASGTYTPTAGTKSIITEIVGGGGGSGGVAATASNSSGVSPAGSSGAYAKCYFTSGFSGVAVTVGAAGAAGAAGGNGGNGGTSSFGSLVSCQGGNGSVYGAASTGLAGPGGPVVPSYPTGSGFLETSVGAQPNNALQPAVGFATGLSAPPSAMPGTTCGQGGNGVYNNISSAAIPGKAGNAGLIIVYEYA
jgi:hypothetical protein